MHSFLFSFILLALSSFGHAEEAPVRAQDLSYGTVLYEYYQGHAFEALSTLNVAKMKGGIKDHGDHPSLVEGGLMLSYGMTKEAKKIFESLLSTDENSTLQVSLSDQNQAWFYLGKIFYLEQDYVLSLEAFDKINLILLQQEKPELFNELLYLKGQIAYLSKNGVEELIKQINVLPAGVIWQSYLRYNRAVLKINIGKTDDAIDEFKALSNTLELQLADADLPLTQEEESEVRALRERCLLSLGQLYLKSSKSQEALAALSGIRKDSVFSEQALFSYAVAATNAGKFGLALEALNRLKSKPLFTPWMQQVPYALAYLYEQLKEPDLALQAYRAAANHYQQLSAQIEQNKQSLSEQKILAALNIIESGQPGFNMAKLETDAYGHLKVQPEDFNIAELLSSEKFQRVISELHELYKLKFSLARWESQLASFEDMLSARSQLRAQRISATNKALTEQHAEQWQTQQQKMRDEIQTAHRSDDAYFFMDETHIDFYQQIQGVFSKLSDFPKGEEKQRYLARIKRLQSYFKWQINDRYSVNRWQAEKQVIALQKQMTAFSGHHQKLKQEMSANIKNDQLASRVQNGRERLVALKTSLELSLESSRQQLIEHVRLDLQKQSVETKNYLLASRKAQARLSDVRYQDLLIKEEAP